MATPIQCDERSNNCLANTYCPSDSSIFEDCIPCSELKDKTDYHSCNCVDKTVSQNCISCDKGLCVECRDNYKINNGKCFKCQENCQSCSSDNVCALCGPGLFLDTGNCSQCSANCQNCSDATTCTVCAAGYYLENSKCVACKITNCSECSTADKCEVCQEGFVVQDNSCAQICSQETSCAGDKTFCDLEDKVCKVCGADCDKCKSEIICGACTAPKVANINGVCEDSCVVAAIDGQYCKNGTAEACAEGITSECKCDAAKNCASCSEDKSKCDSCLPGFKKEGDECKQCDEGYEAFETLCLISGDSESAAKLSGGAIAGIVIGVIVVVGGVGGGLAYYFIQKNKK